MSRSVSVQSPAGGGSRFSARALLQDWVLALVAAAAAGGLLAAAMMLTGTDEKGGSGAVSAAVASQLIYQPLPEFVADLTGPKGGRAHYVSIAAVVEVPEEAVGKLQQRRTQIVAEVQTRLRERRRQELVGATGTALVREQLQSIVNQEIAPDRVRTVLFTRFLLD